MNSLDVSAAGNSGARGSTGREQLMQGNRPLWFLGFLAISGWIAFLVVLLKPSASPYYAITGQVGHKLPPMYGQVKEKTIWLYWNKRGTIPEFVKVCIETIRKNKGSFDVRLLYQDEIDQYVSRIELPLQWSSLLPAQQKDSLMNALLARYGGVALDATVVLFEPLDAWWNQMVSQQAIFRGFMYNALREDDPDTETVVWFLMARKEGLFRAATTAQVIGMGDDANTDRYSNNPDEELRKKYRYFAMGDGTVTPIIGLYDRSRSKCYHNWQHDDAFGNCYPPKPPADDEDLGPSKLIIRNPVESAQLPYANHYNFPLWKVSEHADEWNTFKSRFEDKDLMPFVKMFQSGGPDAKKMSREQLLADKDTFFCNFLCLAYKHDDCSTVANCGVDAGATQGMFAVEDLAA
eukprot:TRINITY_DN23113_c0_g1_i1.p1 TRINITY_DN23113_c0_g1~~TRINITY_DN23113_c0_g1_i1.p1  ORF type:complete len:406 (-),score=52.80 TRINITY_DN23113_c0_g1_i1:189-1406(-)